MKKIEHQYFGQLSFDMADNVNVIWEKIINGIDVYLWFDQNVELPNGILDIYAHFLENIDEKIQEARKALIAYLKEDNYYINFHIEECGLEDLPNEVTDFVMKMAVTNLGLWIDNEKPHITMDFMISPDESDEILCVKFGEGENIKAIDWES